jgi:F0F1-type ATP synthase membrane subunit c/vacuolar-type H+-ATPase subunit K
MTKPTFGIQAIAIQPEIAIPRINPDIFIVPILTLTYSLIGMVISFTGPACFWSRVLI